MDGNGDTTNIWQVVVGECSHSQRLAGNPVLVQIEVPVEVFLADDQGVYPQCSKAYKTKDQQEPGEAGVK